jgi:hypothetical protein
VHDGDHRLVVRLDDRNTIAPIERGSQLMDEPLWDVAHHAAALLDVIDPEELNQLDLQASDRPLRTSPLRMPRKLVAPLWLPKPRFAGSSQGDRDDRLPLALDCWRDVFLHVVASSPAPAEAAFLTQPPVRAAMRKRSANPIFPANREPANLVSIATTVETAWI